MSLFIYLSESLCIFCIRDESSLITRYKRVLFEMRLYSKCLSQNTTLTGGGPLVAKPKEVKIEPSGSILQVFQQFGHLMTGRVPFYSNGLLFADEVSLEINSVDDNLQTSVDNR